MRDLKAEGHTIIFIDHKLDEVLEIADTITVIRAGKTIDTVKPEDVTARDLAELMVGSELPVPELRESTVTDHVVIEAIDAAADDDAGSPKLRAVTVKVHKGEILGIAGVEGNGQTEFVEALIGMRPLTSGSISLGGVLMKGWGTRQRREAGIGYIPEDRTRRGLLAGFPLWENAMLGQQSMEPFVKNGFWIQREAGRTHTQKIVEQFDVRTPSVDVAAHALSGGNQQKLIVGREMSAELVALIAAHPTRGIDVGAQAAVWEELRHARAAGLAVILISADLEELIGLSDRLVVMLRGELVAELEPAQVTPRDLGSYMTGASTQGGGT
jgi:ABC-type uncharacterized transport system ATPase subunit